MPFELAPGAVVAGRYRLDRLIGRGGMGEVWAAQQTLTRKPVALKFLMGSKAGEADVRKRFVREARAACAVQHPNVVQIHDVLELDDGAPVMVMELLSGESLEGRLKREGAMPLGELAAVLLRVVSAVGTAHALGIVHRDLKPDNIFLAETPDGVDVKVLDFGIAKLTATGEGEGGETGGLTQTGAMLGTPFYMSPEQAFGEKKIDHRADIWSLGIILYRGITGVLPTQADNIGQILKIVMTNSIRPIEELVQEVPADLARLVGRMLSQRPDDRPSNLLEVKEVLERYAGVVVDAFGAPAAPTAEATNSTSVPGPARTAAGAARRGRAGLAAAIALLAIAIAGAALALVAGRRAPAESIASVDAGSPAAPEVVAASEPVAAPLAASAPASPAPASSVRPPAASVPPGSSTAAAVAAPSVRTAAPKATSQPAATAAPRAKPASIGGVVEEAPF